MKPTCTCFCLDIKIETKFAYLDFVENSISASLPDPQNEPEMFMLVKAFQIHSHSRTC